jgi:hypothetical protein
LERLGKPLQGNYHSAGKSVETRSWSFYAPASPDWGDFLAEDRRGVFAPSSQPATVAGNVSRLPPFLPDFSYRAPERVMGTVEYPCHLFLNIM